MNELDKVLDKMQEEITPKGTVYSVQELLKALGLKNKDQLMKCIELAQNAKKQKNDSVLDKFKN